MAAPQTKMIYDLQDADLSVVLTQGRLVAEEAKRTFGPLSAEQINWKPGEAEWSIGQCFDHLIISNRPYFTIIEEKSDVTARIVEDWLAGIEGSD